MVRHLEARFRRARTENQAKIEAAEKALAVEIHEARRDSGVIECAFSRRVRGVT